MPVLAFSLIGLWRWFKRKPSDPLAWLCLAGMALFLAANASFNGWHGGAVVCARYQIPVLGFWALAWKELPWTGLGKKLFLGAAAFSAFNMLSVTAVSPMMPDGREHGGLYGWTTPRFLSGKLAGEGTRGFFVLRINGRRHWEPTNGGLLLGLGGLWSLLRLAGGLGAGFFLLRRRGALQAALLAAALSGSALAADSVADLVRPLEARHPGLSGLFVLDRGEDSLLARYWMIEHASKTIDAQYFIWTADNVGILAAEALLRAADRGVRVRVIVDDLLVDAPAGQMLALAKHPNADIRIYNPNLNLGTRPLRRLWNALSDLREVNQRMHDKTFVVDGAAAMTGGRNVADEYFDFDQAYNFRDRDILVVGPGARAMQASFQRFWDDARSVPVERLLAPAAGDPPAEKVYEDLRAYARDPANFAAEVRGALAQLPRRVPELVQELVWARARFLCDIPGKNPGQEGLKGSGATTRTIAAAAAGARKSVTIQSPYCVLTPEALELLGGLARRGVSVRILTNSLAASDNLKATSGYLKQRRRILDAGIRVFEFRPDPDIRRRLMAATRAETDKPPIFAVHAKTLVVDSRTLFIGTFNLDPRSAHLNTEAGILVDSPRLAVEVERAIEVEMSPGNAWPAGTADGQAPWGHRIKAFLYRLLPLTPLL
ncbi:MAG: phospholipase D family protein, partial [Elusimicrobiota bacterium]